MKTRVAHAASTALLTSSLLVLSAFAQECDRDFYVASQDDLTDISSNCSTIHGSIFINGTYNDPFILSGITNITRSILVAWWNDAPVPQIPTVELRDLRYIDSIELPFLVASNFSAPDLETVKSLRLGQAKAGSEALLPSLRFGDTVSVIGNYSRIVLDSLERANTSLNICTMPYCDEEFGKSIIDRPLNVTLPSLVAANRLTIATKASIVSAPKLVSIADFSDIQSQQLRLQLPEAPVSISFPMLEVLNGSLEVDGAIESIDLPSLLNTSKSINIATSHPLNLSLPLVSSSAYIALIGELERYVVHQVTSTFLFLSRV
ncbi:hypothetical protein BJY00DRAFT_278830 [Aspergillus carlsbadensis]|nr:hypothetical protein BJY00DRAFT_278830 [Aspergillus carlsbadensis]